MDLRTHTPEDVLALVEQYLDVRLDPSTAAYGNTGATAGFRSDAGTWVRLQWRPSLKLNAQSWTGAEAASVLQGVSKPELLRSVRWRDEVRDVVWRADETTLIEGAVISSAGSVTNDPGLSDAWWADLKASLAALAVHQTPRVGMPQDHLTRRVTEVFGDSVDTTVDDWTTAHADLHWGNLTTPSCSLLDWEDWGVAPRGYDAATLWGFSLGVPALADRVQAEFAKDLNTRPGKLARLLFCANVVRAYNRNGATMPFTEPARDAATSLLDDLKG